MTTSCFFLTLGGLSMFEVWKIKENNWQELWSLFCFLLLQNLSDERVQTNGQVRRSEIIFVAKTCVFHVSAQKTDLSYFPPSEVSEKHCKNLCTLSFFSFLTRNSQNNVARVSQSPIEEYPASPMLIIMMTFTYNGWINLMHQEDTSSCCKIFWLWRIRILLLDLSYGMVGKNFTWFENGRHPLPNSHTRFGCEEVSLSNSLIRICLQRGKQCAGCVQGDGAVNRGSIIHLLRDEER